MRKVNLILVAGAVLLGALGLSSTNSTLTSKEMTLTSVLEGNKETVKVKRMVVGGDTPKATFTEDGAGTSTLVSPAMAQRVENEDGGYNLRFVAAVKAELSGEVGNVSAVMPGDVGFHVAYEDKDLTYDVQNAYLSLAAGGSYYYANEYSTWYGDNGENNSSNKSMAEWLSLGGFDDNGYNLFITVEVQNIPVEKVETLMKVQTYVRSEEGTYEYSKYTKYADASGESLYLLSVTGADEDRLLTLEKNPENVGEYMSLGVVLEDGDLVSVMDSYGKEYNTFKGSLGYDSTEGYVAPRSGSYDFYFKSSEFVTENERNQTWVTEADPVYTYSIDENESILYEGEVELELTVGQVIRLYKDSVLSETITVEKDSKYALTVSNDKLSLIDLDELSEVSRLYLIPNSNWLADNARFALYYFDDVGLQGWTNLTKDPLEHNRYYVDISEINGGDLEGLSIIFCRMNPSTTENNWDNKWNQTDNLTIPSGQNCYQVKEDTWDKGGGEWSLVTFE